MNIVSAAFSSYVLALAKNSYEKREQKMLMKLTTGVSKVRLAGHIRPTVLGD